MQIARSYSTLISLGATVSFVGFATVFTYDSLVNSVNVWLACGVVIHGLGTIIFLVVCDFPSLRDQPIPSGSIRELIDDNTLGADTVLANSEIQVQFQHQQWDSLDSKLQGIVGFSVTLLGLFVAVLSLQETQPQTLPLLYAEVTSALLAVGTILIGLVASRISSISGGANPLSLTKYASRPDRTEQRIKWVSANWRAFVVNEKKLAQKAMLVKTAQDAMALLFILAIVGLNLIAFS